MPIILDLNFMKVKQTIAAFLVETQEGPVLIETGPYSTFSELKKQVNVHGYQLEDIRHVLLTHIHFDHAGAAWALAQHGAQIYVHPAGARHLANPTKLYESAKRIYQEEMDVIWGAMEPISAKQITEVGHKRKIRIGKTKFKAWHTPGHAPHHIAWEYNRTLFSGDVAGVRIGSGVPMPPCPPPDIDVEAWKMSIRLLLEQRFEALYLTHFGEVQDVKNHLIELRARLINWATWIKPILDLQLPEEELQSKFQAYVNQQMLAAGMEPPDLKRYELANPLFMSVWGLTRYWKKKEGK